MRSARSVVFFSLSAPLLLLQIFPSSCLPETGGGGGGGTPGFNLPPTVTLSTDVRRGVAPLTVQFSSSGSTDDGVIIQRNWDFGDGATSQEIAPRHTYTSTGVYTVRLTLVDDQSAEASRTTTISVTERPVAVIRVDRTSAESSPAVFNFDGSESFDPDAREGETLQYRWDFGDGSREILATVAHTFATPGTYRVRLTVTDAVGVQGFSEVIIQVGIPVPTISIKLPASGLGNVVATPGSALYVQADFGVTPGVPYTLAAGLDGDQDICDGQAVTYTTSTAQLGQTLSGATAPVRVAVFTTDGARVLSAGEDGTVRLYNASTAAVVRSYSAARGAVGGLAVHPSGQWFAAGYADGTVVLREVNSDVIVRTMVAGANTAIEGLAFSPDGNVLASADVGGTAILWRVSDGTALFRLAHAEASVRAVAFSSNGAVLATGASDRTARTWNVGTGALIQEFSPVFNNGVLVAGHAGAVNGVAFSGDGSILATASLDTTVKFWNATSGAEIRTFRGHTGGVNDVVFSRDSQQILTGADDGATILWNAADAQQVRTFRKCQSAVRSVEFSPDGATIVTAVAAANSLQLDSTPPQGNDLNLSLPTRLDLINVPTGDTGQTYYLWAEIRTDRTAPVRTYSNVRVNVLPGTGDLERFPQDFVNPDSIPNAPLVNVLDPATGLTLETANVLMPEDSPRQIFGIGQLDVGDRVYLSLLTNPGYGPVYTLNELDPLAQGGFSILMLDQLEAMFAWYDSGRVLFTQDSKLVVGHASNYYIVADGTFGQNTPSVRVQVQRRFADDSAPRRQLIHLNFDGANGIAVGGSTPFSIAPFTIPGRSPGQVATVKSSILSRVQTMLADWRFVVFTDPNTLSADDRVLPRQTIYFDHQGNLMRARLPDVNGDGVADENDLDFWGLSSFLDPRNATLTGHAVIEVAELIDPNDPYNFEDLSDALLGLVIGNATAHHAGLLSGLRETDAPVQPDVMTNDSSEVGNGALMFTTADLAPVDDLEPIGVQNAPQTFTELFGRQ